MRPRDTGRGTLQAGLAPLVVASGVKAEAYAGIGELMEHDLIERGVPKDKDTADFRTTRKTPGKKRKYWQKLASEKKWNG